MFEELWEGHCGYKRGKKRGKLCIKSEVGISQFSSVQSLNRVWLFVTPWITAHQASLSITNSWSLLKLMPIESVMPSSQLILCHPLLLLSPIPPSVRVFSNESTLRMRWPIDETFCRALLGLVRPSQDFEFYSKVSEKLLEETGMIRFVSGRLCSINVIHLINRLKRDEIPTSLSH